MGPLKVLGLAAEAMGPCQVLNYVAYHIINPSTDKDTSVKYKEWTPTRAIIYTMPEERNGDREKRQEGVGLHVFVTPAFRDSDEIDAVTHDALFDSRSNAREANYSGVVGAEEIPPEYD
ncbi:hypothetical protein LguiA_007715 [Lonicera macranthoides]